ncbi:GDYXXLXY domain-containing protein [Rahnella aquatilis]|uniref:Putative membrane-anchored protein n=1 Tax=Rahnella aquatilis (strain ATCC 33071 / DSM 4594 / JCM 1683 / NBRC 105701 / NCIMB 13365 / CIP 78.65) TaxID=745277 RepID=H2IY92_RAHAC|nr:GDYXXLXY domain-containing protein [Rahnella aquatilis]AEX54218.1 putative membrane-anchored protein [Rahnella aquatilis CIP 78.65 = ATCC 33071]KFD00497.1 putative membrane protein [Rahnella aquatilis CIP 78.65 = ATCC 33071]
MQTRNLRKWMSGLVVLLGLLAVNFGIWQKERVLKQGAVMVLPLAPVDPRSLMQGDYMALDYAITRSLQQELYQQRQVCDSVPSVSCLPLSGKIVVEMNEQRQVIRAQFDHAEPLKPNELRVNYHMNAGTLRVGTDAYFFQEGQGERFTRARYGAFRVGEDGTALLTAMLDENGTMIQP